MATSKTLTPTNVTIQIPEFTDQPDQRVNSNCIDKEADAINALNNNLSNLIKFVYTPSTVSASGGTATISYPTGYDKTNCIPFCSFLYINNSSPRYFTAAEVQYTDTDGIHVINNGGAGGQIFVGITKYV